MESQETGVLLLYRVIKALLRVGYGRRALGLSVVTWQSVAVSEAERVEASGASGASVQGWWDRWRRSMGSGGPVSGFTAQ